MEKFKKVVVTNVDNDGFFEVIIYDRGMEKVASFKVVSFETEIYAEFIAQKLPT